MLSPVRPRAAISTKDRCRDIPRSPSAPRGKCRHKSAPAAGRYLAQGSPVTGHSLIVARRPPSVPEAEEAPAEGEATDAEEAAPKLRPPEDPAQGEATDAEEAAPKLGSPEDPAQGEATDAEEEAPILEPPENPAQGKITRVQGERGEYIVGHAFYQSFDLEMDTRQIDFTPASSQVRFPPGDVPQQAAVSVVAANSGAYFPARYSVGLDGLVVECFQELGVSGQSPCEDWPHERSSCSMRFEVLFLPSTQVDIDVMVARKRRPGSLRISGSWPTLCIHLLFPTRREAVVAQGQFRAGVSRVVNSLHTIVPSGTPPLTWAPLNNRPGPPYMTRGPYLVGGYVLHTDRCPEEAFVSTLLWAELWGPNPFGYVRIYLYNNHKPTGCYLQSLCWPKPHDCDVPSPLCWPKSHDYDVHVSGSVVNIDYEDPDGKDYDPFTEKAMAYFAFRSDEEARLWMDIVASVYCRPSRSFHQHLAPRNQVENLDCRIGELNRTLNKAKSLAAEEPLMHSDSASILGPRPDPVPMDEIAVEARAEREIEGLHMLEEVAKIKLNATTATRGMVATETTEILSSM